MTLAQLIPKLEVGTIERARELLQLHFPTYRLEVSSAPNTRTTGMWLIKDSAGQVLHAIGRNTMGSAMTKGTKVKWTTASGINGSGVVISDEEDGHVNVAVDAPQGEEHRVIHCTVTWLTAY